MTRRLLLAILLACCARAQAAQKPISLLWVPGGPIDAQGLNKLIERRPELRLSIGVAPQDLPALSTASAALGALWASGHVECVLRLDGDPGLTAAPATRRELTPLVAASSRTVSRALGRAPEGFVPGAGALDESAAATLGARGFKWAVAGAAASAEPYRLAGGLVVIPARAHSDDWPARPAREEAVVVLDENAGAPPLGSGLAAIERLAEAAARPWQLVSARASAAAPGTLASAAPSWFGETPPWQLPERARTVEELRKAADAVERYQNSGAAQLGLIDKASSLLRPLESERYLLGAAPGAQFDAAVAKIYETLGQRPPAGMTASVAAEAGLVRAQAEPGRIVLENAPAPPGAPACRLERLELDFDAEDVDFRVVFATGGWPAAGPAADVYVDINHRPGAGSPELLPGRAAFTRAADAWEFALALSSTGADFYRWGPQGIALAKHLKASWDPASAALAASVPTTLLRGKPGSWGYLAFCVEPGPDGARLLTALAPRAEQAQLTSPKASAKPRFSAQRLDPTQAARTREDAP